MSRPRFEDGRGMTPDPWMDFSGVPCDDPAERAGEPFVEPASEFSRWRSPLGNEPDIEDMRGGGR